MSTVLDTNVIIGAIKDDDFHHEWSVDKIAISRENGPLLIPDIVYAELTMGVASVNEADEIVRQLGIERVRNSTSSMFEAGRAYLNYKEAHAGQFKAGVLPDFLIGSFAKDIDAVLLTANRRDYTRYFPTIVIIAPDIVVGVEPTP